MYKWFKTCRTAEEGKTLYRKLVKQYHPDNGGNISIIQEINSEFKVWWDRHKDMHYSSDTGKVYEETEKRTKETAEDFITIIENLRTLTGIEVEQCGSWLWISGNTYPVRKELTTFGCRWSKSKSKWYWAKDLGNYKPKTGKSMDWIKSRYGSEKVDLSSYEKIG